MTAVLWKDLVAFAARRSDLGRRLTGQLVVVNHDVVAGRSPEVGDPSSRLTPATLCGTRADVDFDGYPPSLLSAAHGAFVTEKGRRDFGRWLVDAFEGPAFARGSAAAGPEGVDAPDLFHLYWGPTRQVFDIPPSAARTDAAIAVSIPFASRWRRLADRIADRLSPFVALHWRMEAVGDHANTVPPFVECATDAAGVVDGLGVGAVYFMTDFPLDGDERFHSDSFVKFLRARPRYRAAARAGIDRLVEHYAHRDSRAFTRLADEDVRVAFRNGTLVRIDDLDNGLNGVLDKMVAERAEHYLVGEPNVCGRHSSYALQIVVERVLRRREDPLSRLEAAVDYFPRGGRYTFDADLGALADEVRHEAATTDAWSRSG